MSGPAQAGKSTRHVVVLDVDDTLYLERHYVASGFRAVGDRVARELGLNRFAELATRLFLSGERTKIFDAVLREHGVFPAPELIDYLVGVYRSHEPAIEMEPDARRFVARERQSRALAIISDGFLEAQRAKVRALGIDAALCWPIVLTDAFGRKWWKPDPRSFEHVQRHFDLPAHRYVYVADNPAKDFLGPAKLGWKTIRIRRDGGLHCHSICNPPVDLEIESFDELTEARLDSLLEIDVIEDIAIL
jgi:putative hydrolase of the HAD superfamily